MSNEHNSAPAVPKGWTDADSDSARLALELECLLMDTKDLSVVSKWGASANEALELHRQRLAATTAPGPAHDAVAVAYRETITGRLCDPQDDHRLRHPLCYRPLVFGDTLSPAPAQEFNKSVADAEIKAMYVESQGSDKGWLGIEGSYFIGGVVAARKQKAALAPAQGEPFGHFRVEPFGWTDCAEDDEGAIALYERPQGVGLTDEALDNLIEDLSEWSRHVVEDTAHQTLEAHVREVLATNPIIAALRAKGGK